MCSLAGGGGGYFDKWLLTFHNHWMAFLGYCTWRMSQSLNCFSRWPEIFSGKHWVWRGFEYLVVVCNLNSLGFPTFSDLSSILEIQCKEILFILFVFFCTASFGSLLLRPWDEHVLNVNIVILMPNDQIGHQNCVVAVCQFKLQPY